MSSEQIANDAPVVAPVVTVNGVDITYACTIDPIAQTIELPDNLPGGSEVYVDSIWFCTTPVSLSDRAGHAQAVKRKQGFNLKPLVVAIRAALLGGA